MEELQKSLSVIQVRCDILQERCNKKITKNFDLKQKVVELEAIIKKEVD